MGTASWIFFISVEPYKMSTYYALLAVSTSAGGLLVAKWGTEVACTATANREGLNKDRVYQQS